LTAFLLVTYDASPLNNPEALNELFYFAE
jgi:hypothetical protein